MENDFRVYTHREAIMDLLEKAAHGLRLAEMAIDLTDTLYGVTTNGPTLAAIRVSKTEFIKLGEGIVALVDRIEEDRSDA